MAKSGFWTSCTLSILLVEADSDPVGAERLGEKRLLSQKEKEVQKPHKGANFKMRQVHTERFCNA